MHLLKYSELFNFFSHPKPKEIRPNLIYGVLSSLKIYLIFIIAIGIVNIINSFVFDEQLTNRTINLIFYCQSHLESENKLILFLTISILIPIFMGLVFFLFLTKYKLKYIIISVSFLFGFGMWLLLNPLFFIPNNLITVYPVMFISTIVFALPFGFFVYSLRKKINANWNKLFPYLFYLMAFLFSSMSILNYNIEHVNIYHLPLIILPYYLYGLFFGYIRVTLGFWYAVIINMIFNFVYLGRIFL